MTETEQADEPKTKARSKRKVAWHALRSVGLLLILPVLFVLVAAVMLFDRDITAPSWVKAEVSQRAESALAGGSIEFGAINVNVGRDLHPRLRLEDTTLRDANGEVLVNVDEISGLISPRGLVLERAALLQEAVFSGIELTLNRTAEGEVALSFDNSSGPAQTAPDLISLLTQVEQVFEQPALVALEQIELADLSIVYRDDRSDQTWQVESGGASLDLRGDQLLAVAELPFVQASGEMGLAALDLRQMRSSGQADLAVSIENIRAKDLAAQSSAVSFLANVDAPLTASLQMSIEEGGVFTPIRVALNLYEGVVKTGPNTPGLEFETAQALLSFDPATRIATFDAVLMSSDWGGLNALGQSILIGTDQGLPTEIISQFTVRDVTLSPPGIFAEPISIDGASIDLRASLDPFVLDIGQFVVHDAHQPLQAAGRVLVDDQGVTADLDFEVPRIEHTDLRAWWPEGRKVGTREWLTENVTTGVLVDMVGGVRIRPELPAMYSVGFQYEDATVKYLKDLPPIENGSGYASFLDNAFFLSVDEGYIEAPQGGQIDLEGSDLEIRDLRIKGGPIDLNIRGASSITAALSTLDLSPFEFMQKANLPVTLADGLVQFEGLVTFPLKKKLTKPEVAFSFDANLRRISSESLIPNRSLTAPDLRLAVTADRLELEGDLSVDGVPLAANYTQTFGPDGARLVTGQVELSQRFLDGFNISLPPGTLRGEGRSAFEIALPKDAPPEFGMTTDLAGVGVSIPALNWSMSERATGLLSISGSLANPVQLDRLEIDGPGLDLVGSVDLSPTGGFERAQFSQLRVGNWLNAPVTLRGRGAGQPAAVQINGGALDLRQASFGAGQSRSGPLDLNFDRLQVTEGIALTDFRGAFDEGVGLSGQFTADINGQTAIRGTLVPQNGRTAMRLQTDDAGRAAAAAGLLRNGVGGVLDLTLIPAEQDGVFDGVLKIERLRVRDAPAMAALLDAISVVGLLQQLDGQGLAFEEVDARFRLTPTQLIVTEASAVGPGLGISIDGIYTLASKSMDFQGVISPVYLLNGIGSLLTRKGEGLIGFNFNLTGQTDNPNVLVNPLSALTPGMFRELFRRPPPQVSQ